jgi:drug/metabolite transporter (DMT)-like permease
VPPLLVLHLVILAWAFTAILGKLISLPALDMVVWRTGLATAGFILIALAMRAPLRLAKRDAGILFGLGAILGLHWVLFFLSARLATASVSLAAMPTMMIWCTLIEPFVNGTRRWSRVELILGMVIIAAVWMIYAVELKHWFGFTVGIISALVASIYAVLNKQVVARYHFASLCTWQLGGACAAAWVLLPFVSGTALPAMPHARDLGWLALFAFGCTVLPYAAFVYVMRRMSVFTVNVVYNLEPLYGILLAALIFGAKEQMTPGFYAGAAIIIASVLAVPWLQRRAV